MIGGAIEGKGLDPDRGIASEVVEAIEVGLEVGSVPVAGDVHDHEKIGKRSGSVKRRGCRP